METSNSGIRLKEKLAATHKAETKLTICLKKTCIRILILD